MDAETLSGFLDETANFSSSDDIFSVLEAWENASDYNNLTTGDETFEFQKSAAMSGAAPKSYEAELESAASQACKRQKLTTNAASQLEEGQNKISHITVERNRRKQMNDHLSVLRSLMPCFYVKRVSHSSHYKLIN